MDNMLYIVAGLVIILLLVVLVMRRNRAQRPSVVDRKFEGHKAQPSPTIDRSTSEVTKFDNITVAQRFIDQQRYDKAVEALERGLAEKPYNGPLLLKLLDVYIATNQNDDFYRTYNTIQTHSDQATIEQAQQLKNSMGGQHSNSADSTVSRNIRLETKTSAETSNATTQTDPVAPATPSTVAAVDQDDFSLDFDTSYSVTDESNPTSTVDTIGNEQNNDSFDLTLDDLETTDLGSIDGTLSGGSDDKLTDTQPVVSADTVNQATANIDDDFTFDFDGYSNDTSDNATDEVIEAPTNNLTDNLSINEALVADNSLDINASSPTDELSFDDDFVLDLEDLVSDTDAQNKADMDTLSSDKLSAAESDMENFTFSLDDSDDEDTNDDDAIITINDIAEDKALSDNATVTTNNTPEAIELKTADSSISNPTSDSASTALDFDDQSSIEDEWLIDDDFINSFDESVDVDSASVSTPVTTELATVEANEQTPVDFDSQFSADFDFVKSLDSHQVTLDLADQYLQLGEYDSARRLLTEVVNQGSSEQQQRAQTLLARTT